MGAQGIDAYDNLLSRLRSSHNVSDQAGEASFKELSLQGDEATTENTEESGDVWLSDQNSKRCKET